MSTNNEVNFLIYLKERFPEAFKNHRITQKRYLCASPGDRTVSIGLLKDAVSVRLNVPSNEFTRIQTFVNELKALVKAEKLPGEFEVPVKDFKSKQYASFCIKHFMDIESRNDADLEWIYRCWCIFQKYWDNVQ